MSPSQQEILQSYIAAFCRGLVAAGLRHLVLAPGGRSTPLAMLAAEEPKIRIWRHIDERSAAYFALGLARTLRQPAALLCTSGTAAVNFHPAVSEAFHARVPLMVITADRPHELRDTGAPQTMDQLHLYGTHVKWFHELSPPADLPRLRQYAATTAGRALQVAGAAPAGPVHINVPLRKPLIPVAPESEDGVLSDGAQHEALVHRRFTQGERALNGAQLEAVAGDLADCRRGLIICGMQDDPGFPAALSRLSSLLPWPVLADPLSGVRRGTHCPETIVNAYDAVLRQAEMMDRLAPDTVLRFGAQPVSKALAQYLQQHRGAHRHLVVDGGDGWRDPLAVATDLLHVQPRRFCVELARQLESQPRERAGNSHALGAWTRRWMEAGEVCRQAMTGALLELEQPFEGRVVHELGQLLELAGESVGKTAILYVGNSMPVRDVDSFLQPSRRPLRILANRGVNGIDGVVSSALGAAAAGAGRVILLLGDLSFYHDLGGLLAAHAYNLDLTVVLVNNDGGGIFSFLPQADQQRETFELLFGTPTGLDFGPSVTGTFGGSFVRAGDWSHFRHAVQTALASPGLNVIEVVTDRDANVAMHEQVWAAAGRAVSEALETEASRGSEG